jgi:hypothetical protein
MTAAFLIAVLVSCAGMTARQATPAAPVSTTPPVTSVAPATAGTPTAAVRPLSPAGERAVSARARAWWIARERRDHKGMYDLFEPAYRKQVTFADFVKESAVRTRFDLAETRIEAVVPETADRVRVKVNMETRPPGLPSGRVTAEDIWVRVSGQWFKVHQDITLPFTTPR